MVKKENILKEKDFHSDKISVQVRIVAMGLLITVWGFLISQSKSTSGIEVNLKNNLLWVAFIALAVMFFDFLQYVCGYANNNALLHKMEQEEKIEIEYDYLDWRYKWQRYFFRLKIICTFFAFIYFVIVIIRHLI